MYNLIVLYLWLSYFCSLRLFIFHINQINAIAICKISKKPKRIRIQKSPQNAQPINPTKPQKPKPHTNQTQTKPHNKNNNNNTILRTLGCVGSRCRWFINRPPPTHHTNLDAIYRWLTTKTRMSKRSCWARRACAPISRAKI